MKIYSKTYFSVFCLLISLVFFFFASREFVEIGNSVNKKTLLVSKQCNHLRHQKITVNFQGLEYSVDVSESFCEDIIIGEYVDLFYNEKLNKVFQKNKRNYPIFIMSIVLVIFSVFILYRWK